MSNTSSTVYVVQDPEGKDITDARQYGSIRVILTGRESTEEAIDLLSNTFKKIKPTDYLMLVGKSVNMGIAVHLALLQTGGVLNLLVWHREHWAYTKETINLQAYGNNKPTNTTAINRPGTIKSGSFK